MSTAVYTGRWTEQSQGHLLGSRVTISNTNARFLVAFIALFDAYVGTLFWNLLSFVIHQYRAGDNKPRDGFFHQLQVLLRNSHEPIGFAQDAVLSGWRWRHRARQVVRQTTLFTTLALFITTLFFAVGILSSQIASMGGVLLDGSNCGFVNTTWTAVANAPQITTELKYGSQFTELLRESILYAQSCYQNPLQQQTGTVNTRYSPGADCGFYVNPTLNWTTKVGAPCPFADPSVCSVPSSEIIQLDTGLLDSIDDLGLNTKRSDRVQFRRLTTCSPITTDGFSNNSFSTTGLPGMYADVAAYAYGSSAAYEISANFSNVMDDDIATWLASNNISFAYPRSSYISSDVAYYIDAVSRLPNWGFDPDRRIAENDDLPVSLFFLGNRGIFIGAPVEDPWFNAKERRKEDVANSVNNGMVPTYYSSVPGSVLGCLEKIQVCNPNGLHPVCSDVDKTWAQTYDPSFKDILAGLGMNALQSEIASNLASYMMSTSLYEVVLSGGQETLMASGKLFGSNVAFSLPLPSNQWQIEVEHWMAISNAWLQRINLFTVTGPTDVMLTPYWQLISSPETQKSADNSFIAINEQLCAAQMIRSSAYQTFSVLGICINFIVGGLIFLAGLSVKYVVPAIRERRRAGRYEAMPNETDISKNRHQAWIVDGNLQLQRIAYEELGMGHWEGGDDRVPTTKAGELFPRPTIICRNGVEVIRGFGPGKGSLLLNKRDASVDMRRDNKIAMMGAMDSSSSTSILQEEVDIGTDNAYNSHRRDFWNSE